MLKNKSTPFRQHHHHRYYAKNEVLMDVSKENLRVGYNDNDGLMLAKGTFWQSSNKKKFSDVM